MSVEFDSREVLKSFLKERNETLVHVVEMLNAKHPEKTTTSQNVTNKLMRNTIRFSEIMEIADILGYEVCFRAKAAKPKQGYIEEDSYSPEYEKIMNDLIFYTKGISQLMELLKNIDYFKKYFSFLRSYIKNLSVYLEIVKKLNMNNLYLFLRNLFIISNINNEKKFLNALLSFYSKF